MTKQHHGAIYVLKLKYANLIKMKMRERNRAGSTLIEVFNVMSVNLRETLCIYENCLLHVGVLYFIYSVIRGSVHSKTNIRRKMDNVLAVLFR